MSEKAVWGHAKRLAGTAVFAGSLLVGLQAAHAITPVTEAPVFYFDGSGYDLTFYGSDGRLTSFSGSYDGITFTDVPMPTDGTYTSSGQLAELDSFSIGYSAPGVYLSGGAPLVDAPGFTYSGTPVVTSGTWGHFEDIGGVYTGSTESFTAIAAPEINGAVLPRAADVLAGFLFVMLRLRRSGGAQGLPI